MAHWMQKIRFLLIVFLFPLAGFSLPPVKSVVFFGDSLTDSGNMAQLLQTSPDEEAIRFLVNPFKRHVYYMTLAFANELNVSEDLFKSSLQLLQAALDKELPLSLVHVFAAIKKEFVFPYPPYWNFRFSNGPLWNEYLAWMLTLKENNKKRVLNQAYAGSWAAPHPLSFNPWDLFSQPAATLKKWLQNPFIPTSLGVAIEAYRFSHTHVSPKTIFFIFSGSNDYIHALQFDENYNPAQMSHYVDNVLKQIQLSLVRLLGSGAHQLVVIGLPHLGNSPKFLNATLDKETLNAAIDIHNERLQTVLQRLRINYPQVDFLYVDINNALEQILASPKEYGFKNVSNPCLQSTSLVSQKEVDGLLCKKPDEYFFWDDLHPTTRVHALLAAVICERMQEHGYKVICKQY